MIQSLRALSSDACPCMLDIMRDSSQRAQQVTDLGLGTLTQLRQLTVLDIMYCHRITDAGVVLLAGSHLSSLNITGCSRLTHRGKQLVSHMACSVAIV